MATRLAGIASSNSMEYEEPTVAGDAIAQLSSLPPRSAVGWRVAVRSAVAAAVDVGASGVGEVVAVMLAWMVEVACGVGATGVFGGEVRRVGVRVGR